MNDRLDRLIPLDNRYMITSGCDWATPWVIPASFENPRIPVEVVVDDHHSGLTHRGQIHVTRPDRQPRNKVGLLIVTPLGDDSAEGRTLDRILWSGRRSVTLIASHPALRLRRACVPVMIIDTFWPATKIHASLRKADDDSIAARVRRIPRIPSRDATLRLVHHEPAA